MKLVMIDNYDSFTYNLVQYFQELGADIEVVRNDQLSCDQIAALEPTHLVISPGPCSPNEAGISLQAIDYFMERLPILGVCLGHQAMAQHFGAKVIRANKVMHGKTSQVSHSGHGLFAGLANPLTATRYHSLVVEPESLPDELEVTAWIDSGPQQPQLIMGLQHRSLPLHGVQFHPESILSQQGHELLANFLGK